MDDEEDDMMLQNHSLIPERDVNGLGGGGIMNNIEMGGGEGGNYSGDGNMFTNFQPSNVMSNHNLGTQAEAAFNQQRVVVARLSREEIEDR